MLRINLALRRLHMPSDLYIVMANLRLCFLLVSSIITITITIIHHHSHHSLIDLSFHNYNKC